MDHYSKLEELLSDLKEDFAKFYEKGNKAAGARVRKGMQDLKVVAQEVRVDVLNKTKESK